MPNHRTVGLVRFLARVRRSVFHRSATATARATVGTFNYQCTNHSGMTGQVIVR